MDTKSKGEAYSSISNSRTSVRFYKIIEKNYKNYCVFSINPHGKYYLPLYSTRIQLLPFSQKKKKTQHLARMLLSFSSRLSMNQCSCPYLYSSLKVSWHRMIYRFFQMLPGDLCCGGSKSNRVPFSYLYCIFANSFSVGSLAVRLTIVLFTPHLC